MDDEMYEDERSDSGSSYSDYPYYRPRSPPPTPPRSEPVSNYDIRYIEGSGSRGKCIDIAFILDCTGSMQRYINSTRDHIIGICDMIRGEEGLSGPDDLRVAVVNYRDHPPQDNSYVYKFNPFSSDIPSVKTYIQGLTASGGGDGPEAVTSGMAAALIELEWRRNASKMVVLIADAPPHGIGEWGDQIKGGDPQGHDPLVIARKMAQEGITLFMVACEETLSGYGNAVDFFQAICNMTSGLMLPLTTADLLAPTIVGSVLENLDMERLVLEIGQEVAQRVRDKGETMESVEAVAQELHERLLLRNEQTKQVHLPDVYIENDISKRNVARWMGANVVGDVAAQIEKVPGRRLTDKFRKKNEESGYSYVPGRLPPRPTAAETTAPPTPSSPTSSLPASFAGPASPRRRVVSDFKAFGSSPAGLAPQSLSVFGAPMLKTGPGGGMFGSAGMTPAMNGGIRGRADDDDDDDDDGPFKRDAISLDQARRIATQSVFRAGRLG